MAHPLVAQIYRSLLARTAVLIVAIIIVLGVATGALPVQCLGGGASCDAEVALAATDRAATNLSANVLSAEPVADAAPTLTDNDLIATTFSMLDVQMQAPSGITNLDATSPQAPSTRLVQTTTIRGGLPLDPYAAQRAATSVPPAVSSEQPVVVAEADLSSSEPAVANAPSSGQDPVQTASPEPPPVDPSITPENTSPSLTGVVAGKGANVRSGPAKAAGNVLFALKGGEQVEILERSKGWLKIRDDRGRTGWIYGEYLSQGGE